MVLLTSGQVSVVISSSIVFSFTIVLFFAGYVLQQQSLRGLQDTLKPIVPTPPHVAVTTPPLSSTLHASRAFGGSRGSGGHVAYQQYVGPQTASKTVDWNRLAHVQLVKSHHAVCNAIMLFGELHRLKSPAKRVLLFPKAWAMEKQAGKKDAFDPFIDTSRRLLRLAARRYAVELRPVGPIIPGADEEAESSYSLASLYAMSDYERVLLLSTPGMILDATPLDSVLAYAPDASLALLQRDTMGRVNETALLLAMPEADAYAVLRSAKSASTFSDEDVIQRNLPDPLVLDSSSDGTKLVTSISLLHDATTEFNATAYLTSAAYIRFSDPKHPGPEYEVPYSDVVRARPKNKDADWVWTELYGKFAQRRMDICGLDLEPWHDY